MSSAPALHTVVLTAAFVFPGCQCAKFRASNHSATGWVLVCQFGSLRQAGAFAASWARDLGRQVFVRRSGSSFSVSVPVAAPAAA